MQLGKFASLPPGISLAIFIEMMAFLFLALWIFLLCISRYQQDRPF